MFTFIYLWAEGMWHGTWGGSKDNFGVSSLLLPCGPRDEHRSSRQAPLSPVIPHQPLLLYFKFPVINTLPLLSQNKPHQSLTQV